MELSKFDYEVIQQASQLKIATEKLYRLVGSHPQYCGYRTRHTEQELLDILEDVINQNYSSKHNLAFPKCNCGASATHEHLASGSKDSAGSYYCCGNSMCCNKIQNK